MPALAALPYSQGLKAFTFLAVINSYVKAHFGAPRYKLTPEPALYSD
jgi:hypothetical protein